MNSLKIALAVLAMIGFADAKLTPHKGNSVAANGGVVVKTSEECTAAIQKLCLKITDDQINECRANNSGYRAKEECVANLAPSEYELEKCQNANIDKLVKAGCEHLRCKKLSRDKCELLPRSANDVLCWVRCYDKHIGEFGRMQCSRPPLKGVKM